MKKILFVIAIILLPVSVQAKTSGKLDIYACESVWGSLASEIVKDKANVLILTNPKQDSHYLMRNKGLIMSVRSADLLFCNGSDLEKNWLPGVIEKAHNIKIRPAGNGYFIAADYIKNKSVNPHFHLNPHNISIIAEEFTKRISEINPTNADFYQKNYEDFIARWNNSIVFWEEQAANLKGMPIIVQSDSWEYLANWLGLKIISILQKDRSIIRNSNHLDEVLKNAKINPAEVVIYAPYDNKDLTLWFYNKSKIRSVMLPYTVYGDVNTKDLFELFNNTLDILIKVSDKDPIKVPLKDYKIFN